MIIDNINFSHLNTNGFDALQFSLMGMSIVFGGLVIIAVYIVLLPRLLDLLSQLNRKRKPEQPPSTQYENEPEILLAIAAAAHLHLNFPEEDERITWKSHGDLESPWQVSGRMHSLGVRKRSNTWNRK